MSMFSDAAAIAEDDEDAEATGRNPQNAGVFVLAWLPKAADIDETVSVS